MPYQSYSIRTRSEMSAPKAKRRQEVAVSECSRPGRSRQEVCDCRESPAPAKTENLLVMLAVFFLVSRQAPVRKKQGSKRSLRRSGGSQQIFSLKIWVVYTTQRDCKIPLGEVLLHSTSPKENKR